MVNEKMKGIIDNLSKGYYFVDKERKIRFWNRKAEIITGYEAEEVIDSFCIDNLLKHADENGEELCKNRCPLVIAMEENKVIEEHVYLQHKDGHRVSVNVKVIPIFAENGEAQGAIELFDREFSDIKNYKKILEKK